MNKPTFDDVIYAVYVLQMNMNSQCPYCGENMEGDKPKYKKVHFEQEHTS